MAVFFAPVKPFWTVLDPIEQLSPVNQRLSELGMDSIPIAAPYLTKI